MNVRDSIYTQQGNKKSKHGKFYGYEHPPTPLSTFEKGLIAVIVGCISFIVLISFSWLWG